MEVGYTINRFTYLGKADYKGNAKKPRKTGYFKCSCGLIKSFDYHAVMGSNIKMCVKCAAIERGKKRKTHGLVKHPLYRKWQDMKNRCYNKNVDRYNAYGALGIKVCSEWRNDFKSFYDWSIKNGWNKSLTIERIDINKNYSPNNCKYIDSRLQPFNKRNTLYIYYGDVKICLAKLMYINGKSDKYKNAWHMLKRAGKTEEYVINKYNLKLQ